MTVLPPLSELIETSFFSNFVHVLSGILNVIDIMTQFFLNNIATLFDVFVLKACLIKRFHFHQIG